MLCFNQSYISSKRKQTQIRGDDQRKQQQRWITDSETKTVPKKKKLQKVQKKYAHHRDQLLHTNVTCKNRNSMQTNIIQLGKREGETEEKKKDRQFTKSLHSSVTKNDHFAA
jgi:predicted lipase